MLLQQASSLIVAFTLVFTLVVHVTSTQKYPDCCSRKDFKIIQDFQYQATFTNQTFVSSPLQEDVNCAHHKAGHFITSTTTYAETATNIFYYKWIPQVIDAKDANATDYMECPKCDLYPSDKVEEFPLVGCDFYEVTSDRLHNSNSVQSVRTDITHTYF